MTQSEILKDYSTDLGFAFLDVETTGLSFKGLDRVVEIGIVLTNSRFEIEREFETLINPGRDVGPTRIHGITASDVVSAPTFKDVQSLIMSLLQNRVVVGHNIAFDVNFLDSEFRRSGSEVNWGNPICTLLISKSAFGGALPRQLPDLSAALGLDHQNAHSALGDARVCVDVARLIESESPGMYWNISQDDTFVAETPLDIGDFQALTRSARRENTQRSFVQEIVSKIPMGHSGGVGLEYMEVLDRALADLVLDQIEKETLVDVALALDLRVDDLDVLHKSYVEEMALAAKSDGVVTEVERKQIYKVAEQLGVSTLFCEQKLSLSQEVANSEITERKFGISLSAGQIVSLTGDMNPSKSFFENLLRERGLIVAENVSKKVSAVFAEDPATASGKAVKARQYGIPVVSVYDWEFFAPPVE